MPVNQLTYVNTTNRKTEQNSLKSSTCLENWIPIGSLSFEQELEADLSAISRRVLLLEDELNKSEIKLAKATMDLAVESKRADKVVKVVNTSTSKAMNDEVEIENLRQGNVC